LNLAQCEFGCRRLGTVRVWVWVWTGVWYGYWYPPTDRLNTLNIRLGQGRAAAAAAKIKTKTPEAAAATTSTLTMCKYSKNSIIEKNRLSFKLNT